VTRKILYIIATLLLATVMLFAPPCMAQHTILHGIFDIAGVWCYDSSGDAMRIEETFEEGTRGCDITGFTRKDDNSGTHFTLRMQNCTDDGHTNKFSTTEQLYSFNARGIQYILRNHTLYTKCK